MSGSLWVGSADLGTNIRTETCGSDETTASLDRIPVTGSSEGGIVSTGFMNFSTRPSL